MPPRPLFKATFGSDPILWAMITYLPGVMARLSQVLAVPKGAQLGPGDEEKLSRAMRQVLLGKRRVAGEVFDAYVSNPDVNRMDFSRVRAPTLLMHARDDPGSPIRQRGRDGAPHPGCMDRHGGERRSPDAW